MFSLLTSGLFRLLSMSNFAMPKTGFGFSLETLLKSYYSEEITMLRETAQQLHVTNKTKQKKPLTEDRIIKHADIQ